MDAAAQKTGQRVQQSGGGIPSNQQQQQQQASGGALSGVSTQQGDAELRSPTDRPSVALHTPRGSVVIDTLTLVFYGVLLADVLLAYIALQVM